MFLWRKDPKEQSVEELEVSAVKGQRGAKRELAKRFMEGKGVQRNLLLSLAHLEDCVADCDTDAMMMLAECCALGRGTGQNRMRAERLITWAAMKGNSHAKRLIDSLSFWETDKTLHLERLLNP